MENLKSSESGALNPTQDGGRSSDTLVNTSSTCNPRRLLMFSKIRIRKDKRLSCGRDTTDGTKDGELFIKINTPRSNLRVTTRNSDSIS